jgi:hypothetical protein
MRRYIISYDLYRPGNNYSELTAEIKRLGEHWEHPIANLWVIDTVLTAGEIRHALAHYLVTGDKLFVSEAGEDMATMDIAPGAPARMIAMSTHERAPVKLLADVLPEIPHQRKAPGRTRLLTASKAESW